MDECRRASSHNQTIFSADNHQPIDAPGTEHSNATDAFKPSKSHQTPTMEVHPICEYSDMRVQLKSEKPFTGFIFAKNRFGSCRIDVDNKSETILSLQFPNFQGTESPCGVAEIVRETCFLYGILFHFGVFRDRISTV